MKLRKMLPLAVLSALYFSAAMAEVVTINNVDKPYRVIGIQLERKQVFDCPDVIQFDQYDEDQDGVLDDICVGAGYNPCDYGMSIIKAYIFMGMTGNGCMTKEEIAEQNRDKCDGFSPAAPGCGEAGIH